MEGKETFVIVSRGKSLKITFEEKKYAASVVARPRPRELLRKKEDELRKSVRGRGNKE